MTSAFEEPSALMLSARVVQTNGATICTNGGRFSLRGIGIATRPPVVWTKRTDSLPASGSERMSGMGSAEKRILREPNPSLVFPIQPWPECP